MSRRGRELGVRPGLAHLGNCFPAFAAARGVLHELDGEIRALGDAGRERQGKNRPPALHQDFRVACHAKIPRLEPFCRKLTLIISLRARQAASRDQRGRLRLPEAAPPKSSTTTPGGVKHGGVDHVCRMHHSDGMAKDAAVTVRLPLGLKRRLEAVARKERRSLSAQITAFLERETHDEAVGVEPGGKLLGRYEGTPVPSDEDLIEVRQLLWGELGRRSGRAA